MADPLALIPLRYYGADPDTIYQEIADDMRLLFPDEWGSMLENGLGQMMLYLSSRGLWRVAYQANFAAGQSIRGGVKTRRAASRIAKQLGYNPRGASSATAELSIALSAVFAFDVPLPAGFAFIGPNGTTWSTAQSYEWEAGDTGAKQITATEGTIRSVTYTSDGSKSQRFAVPISRPTEYLRHGGLTAVVNGATWDEYDTIPASAVDGYEVFYVTDPPTVLFGTGGSGNVPPAGASIVVTYIVSLGPAGNVQAGQITAPQTPLLVGTDVIGLTISQPARAVGGLADEALEAIVQNATDVWKSRGVAVTSDDFRAVALAVNDSRYGRAAEVTAHSPRGAGGDTELSNLLDAARAALGTPEITITAQAALIDTATDEIATATATATANQVVINTSVPLIESKVDEARTAFLEAVDQLSTASAHGTQMATELTAAVGSVGSIFESVAVALTGTVAIANTSAVITGTGTSFTTELKVGDVVTVAGQTRTIAGIGGSLSATVDLAFTATGSGATCTRTRRQAAFGDITALDSRLQKAYSLISLQAAAEAAAESDLNTIATKLLTIETINALIGTTVATSSASLVAISTARTAIETAVVAILAATSGIETAHENALQGIYDHVDLFLAHDATANLVQLLVLSRDTDGFLAAPTVGLLAVIEQAIRAVSEPQTAIEAVNGSSALVVPEIVVTGTYARGKSEAEAEAAVTKALRDYVKTLGWGAGLWYEELYRVVVDLPTTDRLTVTIAGPDEFFDATGNAVLPRNRAFTAPTVTVTLTEAVT